VRFADDLVAHTAAADARLARLVQRIDAFAAESGLDGESGRASRSRPSCGRLPRRPTLDLRQAGIRSVVWATGYSAQYPWLRVPVLDERGEIRHAGGVTAARAST
jgi:putative flavoprotein involved in K+ transport